MRLQWGNLAYPVYLCSILGVLELVKMLLKSHQHYPYSQANLEDIFISWEYP